MAQTWKSDWPLLQKLKTLEPVAPFVNAQFEAGRSRNRRWFTAVPVHFTGSVTFKSQAQAGEFPAWFRNTLNDGAEPFSVIMDTATGRRSVLCQFRGMYQEQRLGPDLYRFTMPLEMLARPGVDPEPDPGPGPELRLVSRDWRLLIFSRYWMDGSDFATHIQVLELRQVAGGENSAQGGVPSASSQFSLDTSAAAAFDPSINTFWSTASGVGFPSWIAYKFPEELTVEQVVIRAGDNVSRADRAPGAFSVQALVGGVWQDAKSFDASSRWAVNETRSFLVY